MRMILLTVGTLISLAVSTPTAVSQSNPETRRFPGAQEWWFTNETSDGSLVLSTQSNVGGRVPFYLFCKLGYTDEKRHVRYSIQFQPPVPPVKDSSDTLVHHFTISGIWDPPDQAHEFSVSVHDNHADRVEVPPDFVDWLLYGKSCHPVAKQNCGGEFVISINHLRPQRKKRTSS